jgi:hypothetical protein
MSYLQGFIVTSFDSYVLCVFVFRVCKGVYLKACIVSKCALLHHHKPNQPTSSVLMQANNM